LSHLSQFVINLTNQLRLSSKICRHSSPTAGTWSRVDANSRGTNGRGPENNASTLSDKQWWSHSPGRL